MPDIKVKDVAKGTVKAIDKSATAAQRMKNAYIRTKEKAEHSAAFQVVWIQRIRLCANLTVKAAKVYRPPKRTFPKQKITLKNGRSTSPKNKCIAKRLKVSGVQPATPRKP